MVIAGVFRDETNELLHLLDYVSHSYEYFYIG